jgi:hypothetical protein
VVTFSYPSYSSEGAPMEPKIDSIRSDVTWSGLLLEFREKKILPLNANCILGLASLSLFSYQDFI